MRHPAYLAGCGLGRTRRPRECSARPDRAARGPAARGAGRGGPGAVGRAVLVSAPGPHWQAAVPRRGAAAPERQRVDRAGRRSPLRSGASGRAGTRRGHSTVRPRPRGHRAGERPQVPLRRLHGTNRDAALDRLGGPAPSTDSVARLGAEPGLAAGALQAVVLGQEDDQARAAALDAALRPLAHEPLEAYLDRLDRDRRHDAGRPRPRAGGGRRRPRWAKRSCAPAAARRTSGSGRRRSCSATDCRRPPPPWTPARSTTRPSSPAASAGTTCPTSTGLPSRGRHHPLRLPRPSSTCSPDGQVQP